MIINEFINLLENYKEKLKVVPYNYENYSCELSCLFANRKKLISNQIKKEHFINFCKNMFKNEVFKLAHPIHNNVEVYAVKDYHYYIQHFIFMIDKDNKYPLLICQAYDFCQFFITTEYIYFNPLSDKWIIDSNQSQCFPYLKSIVKDMKNDINHLYFTQKKYGFYLSDHRPIHYFVETLSSLYILDIFKNTTKNSFYFPKKYKDNFSSDVDVYISPKIFSYVQNIFNDVLDESIIKLNNEILNNEDNDGFIFLDKFKYDLVVWIGIPGDRREWIGWLDGIYNILFNLFQYYDFIKVYFDGMTAFDGLKGEYYENNLKFYKLYEKISILNNSFKGKKQCKLISLIGYDYKTKVKCCSTCDIVLTECSTTMLTPIILCKKPGVVFYNGEEGFKNNALIWMKHKHQKLISEKFVLNNGGSYYISWEHMYNLFLMILIEIKKIESFDIAFKYIPSMEFVVDRYGPSTNFENNQLCLYTKYGTAKTRIQNQLSYKLGQAMIVNSKSLLGYIRMPFVLSYIKDKHKQEQKIYQEKIKKDPSLKLPPLENYPDYKEALKEKECFTYKLGEALIKANKTWYKGGYVKMWFEVGKLKREFKDEYAN